MNGSDVTWIAAIAVVVALSGLAAARYLHPEVQAQANDATTAATADLERYRSAGLINQRLRRSSSAGRAASADTVVTSSTKESLAAVSAEFAGIADQAATAAEALKTDAIQAELEQKRAAASVYVLPEEPMPADPIRIPPEFEEALKAAETRTAMIDLQLNREANAHRSPGSRHIEDSLRQQLIAEPEAILMSFQLRCSYSTCELRVTIPLEYRASNGSELVQNMVRRVLARPEFASNISPGSQRSAAGILKGGGFHQVWNWRLLPY